NKENGCNGIMFAKLKVSNHLKSTVFVISLLPASQHNTGDENWQHVMGKAQE
ncbi:hypothetical protein L9F63_014379, partial [Diploptera punctata]